MSICGDFNSVFFGCVIPYSVSPALTELPKTQKSGLGIAGLALRSGAKPRLIPANRRLLQLLLALQWDANTPAMPAGYRAAALDVQRPLA